MKKKMSTIIITLLLLLLMGCGSSNNDYSITLQGMNDSAYQWNYIIEDDSILSIKEVSHDEASELGNTYEFEVTALKQGTTCIYFDYKKDNDEEPLYDGYAVTLHVNNDLSIERSLESGNYIALQKFLAKGKEKLKLEKDFNKYLFIFNDNVVNIENDECAWLVVYEDNEIIASYGISNSNDHVYINEGEKRVLIQ